MTHPRGVVRHVVDSIGPASAAHAAGARAHVAAAGAPLLDRLAATLGGAQHSARPRAAARRIVVVGADHGCGDPGVALGAGHPTVVAATAIADGSAALAQLARATATPIVVVDAGVAEPDLMPGSVIRLGRRPTADLAAGPAMTVVDAVLGVEAGIALAMSLGAVDVLAVGALGLGSEVSSLALLAATTGAPVLGLGDADAERIGVSAAAHPRGSAFDLLARFGGGETAVLAGILLGAASVNMPVILDGHATGAAALVAARLAPGVVGYLVAAHRGNFTHPAILAELGLEPLFDVGLGHGEGTGAAMALPLVDQVAALCVK